MGFWNEEYSGIIADEGLMRLIWYFQFNNSALAILQQGSRLQFNFYTPLYIGITDCTFSKTCIWIKLFLWHYINTPSVFYYDKHKKNFDIQFSMKRHETV